MRKASIAVLVIMTFLAGGFVSVRLLNFHDRTFGKRYSKDQEADVRELRRLIYLAMPAKQAIDAYNLSEGRAPEALSDIKGLPTYYLRSVFGVDFTHPYWQYLPESNSYQLRMKLNWDADLWYNKERDVWYYDPGDGSADWTVSP